ncbi:MAG: cyclodeaminase/cyclohydrolase family protein [Candidatus Aminicenantia bacterium]
MSHFVEKSINEFLTQLSSDSPTPGGGTTAALAGAISSSLLEMAVRISLKKNPESTALSRVIGITPQWKETLFRLMDADSEAFDQVMAAFKMPKETEEEKKVRSEAIQRALKKAAEVPWQTAEVCFNILQTSCQIKEEINPNTLSDFLTSGLLAFSGLEGALFNVEINLSSIKDEEYKNSLSNKVEELRSEAIKLKDEILEKRKEL